MKTSDLVIWNQEQFIEAAKFAARIHANQKMKSSVANYMLHLSLVVMEVQSAWVKQPVFDIDIAVTTAWLHDSIEDTNTSADEIRSQFGNQVCTCVLALTKNKKLPKKEQMPDSLKRILDAPNEAAIVKLADRITNLQPPPSLWSKDKIELYYSDAKVIYSALHQSNSILASRLAEKIENYRLNF